MVTCSTMTAAPATRRSSQENTGLVRRRQPPREADLPIGGNGTSSVRPERQSADRTSDPELLLRRQPDQDKGMIGLDVGTMKPVRAGPTEDPSEPKGIVFTGKNESTSGIATTACQQNLY